MIDIKMKQAVIFIENLETESSDCRRDWKPKNVKVTVCILLNLQALHYTWLVRRKTSHNWKIYRNFNSAQGWKYCFRLYAELAIGENSSAKNGLRQKGVAINILHPWHVNWFSCIIYSYSESPWSLKSSVDESSTDELNFKRRICLQRRM